MPQGPSQRQLRVGEIVRRALSDILLRGDHLVPELANASITVGEVRMSPDLRQATVYVLPLGGKDAEAVMAGLAEARGELRRQVTKQVTLKFSPQLKFVLDDSFDRLDHTREIFAQPRVARDLDND